MHFSGGRLGHHFEVGDQGSNGTLFDGGVGVTLGGDDERSLSDARVGRVALELEGLLGGGVADEHVLDRGLRLHANLSSQSLMYSSMYSALRKALSICWLTGLGMKLGRSLRTYT